MAQWTQWGVRAQISLHILVREYILKPLKPSCFHLSMSSGSPSSAARHASDMGALPLYPSSLPSTSYVPATRKSKAWVQEQPPPVGEVTGSAAPAKISGPLTRTQIVNLSHSANVLLETLWIVTFCVVPTAGSFGVWARRIKLCLVNR